MKVYHPAILLLAPLMTNPSSRRWKICGHVALHFCQSLDGMP